MNAAVILPAFIFFVFILGAIKRVNVYESFADGIKSALPLVVSVFPYLAAIFTMTTLLEKSGVSAFLIKICSPLLKTLGVPERLCPLVLLKPFSGSASLATLSDIFDELGADCYISRCAACIYGSSETTFYVSAVYFSRCKNKRLFTPIVISLIATLFSCVLACLICKIL